MLQKIKLWIFRVFIKFGIRKATSYSIIKTIPLFSDLTEEQLLQLAQSSQVIFFKKGEIILQKGDIADNFYIIKKGSVSIFINNESDDSNIVLTRLELGNYFGEQALLAETPTKRMASAKAIVDCELLAINHSDYQKILNPQIKKLLNEIGEKELHEIFNRSQMILTSIKESVLTKFPEKLIKYRDKEVIFRAHDKPDRAYFIVSGTVLIMLEEENGKSDAVEITEGNLFGELGVLNQTKRAGTAIAKGDLVVASYDAETFQKLCEASPELREYVLSLKNIYRIKRRGTVQIQRGKFLNLNAVLSIYHLENGSTIKAVKTLGKAFLIGYTDIKESKTIEYTRGTEIKRKLMISDCIPNVTENLDLRPSQSPGVGRLHLAHIANMGDDAIAPTAGAFASSRNQIFNHVGYKIVSVLSIGDWIELDEICNFVLDGTVVTEEQLQSFTNNGSLGIQNLRVLSAEKLEECLCNCLNISKEMVYKEIRLGINNLEDLIQKTGAGSVCGACRPRIIELLGLKAWKTVRLIEKKSLRPDICSFRFQLIENPSLQYKPGQYVVVSALINKQFIDRSYTLTSLAEQGPVIEIIVKKESKGNFSPWLFDQAQKDDLFRISDPQGRFILEEDEQAPIVCLVGGIGITPAIAFARKIFLRGGQRLHIDYSVKLEKDFILLDELKTLTSKQNITIYFRATQNEGRISVEDIKKLITDFPNAKFYVCGPEGYMKFVIENLNKQKIHKTRIKTEEFLYAGVKL